MTDFNQFGSAKPGQTAESRHCAQCEAMLADALDGTLSEKDQVFFDLHMAACPACSAVLADARRGAAWLELLRSPRPEPSEDMLERILLQTSGFSSPITDIHSLQTGEAFGAGAVRSGGAIADFSASGTSNTANTRISPRPNTLLTYSPRTALPLASGTALGKVLPFRSRVAATLRPLGHSLLQPRLAMTAAMAFFSVALTLNLTGVHLNQLRASDLKPSSLRRSVSEANAHVVRYYDSLRVVYELESRVHELQQTSDSESDREVPAAQPASAPGQSAPATPQSNPDGGQQHPSNQNPAGQGRQSRPRPGAGRSFRQDPAESLRFTSVAITKYPLPHTSPQDAMLSPRSFDTKQEGKRA